MMSDNNWEIKIRAAQREDMEAVKELVEELVNYLAKAWPIAAEHVLETMNNAINECDCNKLSWLEELKSKNMVTITDLERDVFDIRPPRFQCLLAEIRTKRGRKIIGCATYGITYSTRKGYCMMLHILFVSADYQRRGIGRKLLSAVAKEVLSAGFNRLLFYVNHWNDGARLFYEGMGASKLKQSGLYEMTDEALQNAALEYV